MSDPTDSNPDQQRAFSGRRSSLKDTGVRDDSVIDYPQALIWDTAAYANPSEQFHRAQSAEPNVSFHRSASGHAQIHSLLNLHNSPLAMNDQQAVVHQPSVMSPPSNKLSPSESTPRQEQTRYTVAASPISSMVSPSQSSMRPGVPSASTSSPAFSISPSWPFQSPHEAKLFYHYVKNIAPWVSDTLILAGA